MSRFPHRVEPTAETRVDRASWQLEHCRDLAGRVVEEVAEHDYGPLLRGERCDLRQQGIVRCTLAGTRRCGERSVEVGLCPQCPRPCVVDCAVDDDSMKPWPEGSAAVEPVKCTNGGEERLLRDVLGGGGIVDDEVGRAMRSAPVEAKQLLERSRRSALCVLHERPLVSPSTRHPLPTVRRICPERSMFVTTSERVVEVRGTSRGPLCV